MSISDDARLAALEYLTDTCTIYSNQELSAVNTASDGRGGLLPNKEGGIGYFVEGTTYPCRLQSKPSDESVADGKISEKYRHTLVLPYDAEVTLQDEVEIVTEFGTRRVVVTSVDGTTDNVTRKCAVEVLK